MTRSPVCIYTRYRVSSCCFCKYTFFFLYLDLKSAFYTYFIPTFLVFIRVKKIGKEKQRKLILTKIFIGSIMKSAKNFNIFRVLDGGQKLFPKIVKPYSSKLCEKITIVHHSHHSFIFKLGGGGSFHLYSLF